MRPPSAGRWALLLLPGLVVLLGHAVVPLDEFVLRGDDAFYYFQVALNHVRHGMWTFDGVHPTNGVQPLWAWLLTGLAHAATAAGLDDPLAFARLAVAATGVVYFAACVGLYLLVARAVSVGTGLAAAGAGLYSLSAVWGRMWGMETALYLLVLFAAMAVFHWRFLPRPTAGAAAGLGLLLGAAGLARLNAGFFVAALLLFYVLRRDGATTRRERLRYAVMIGGVAAAVVGAYLLSNYVATGHLLPVSGAVKAIRSAHARADYPVESLRNALSMIYYAWTDGVLWLVTSRLLDGAWIAGLRLWTDGAAGLTAVGAGLALVAVGPLALGRPRAWAAHLRERLARLAPFGYFAAFAAADAVISALVYPSEPYAATRWWLAPLEVALTVVAATLVVAAGSFIASRLLPAGFRARTLAALVLGLGVAHGVQFVRFYWDGAIQYRDWNSSWNDEPLRAAGWIREHLPPDAVVGAWNAGVVGTFAGRTVVNLDGLINGFGLVPYLRERRIADYIRDEGIGYLSDLEPMFERTGVREDLRLEEVYRHHSEFMNADYVIYRVLATPNGPAPTNPVPDPGS